MKKLLLALLGAGALISSCNVEQRTTTTPRDEKATEETAPEKTPDMTPDKSSDATPSDSKE